MARWRLTEPHYLLTTDPTKWEYHETDRTTGRQVRKQFDVPRYVHPNDPADWTERVGPDDGYVNVSNGNNAQPKDIIFKGEPTPAMICLDDEARAISGKYSDVWKAAENALMDGEYSWAMKMADKQIQQNEKISQRLAEAALQPVPGLDKFMDVMTKVMEQNQQLVMAMTAKQLGVEPVVDTLKPLSKAGK
jgi:hypothetical protein